MKADLIIYNASQIATCRQPGNRFKKGREMRDIGMLEEGAIAISEGRVAAVGKSEEILTEFETENTIDAENMAVIPALVECHTHFVYAGDRLDEFEQKISGAGYLEILAAGGGIISTVNSTRRASLEELIRFSAARLNKLVSLGVAVCEVKTGYGLDLATEIKMLEAIAELDRLSPAELVPTFLAAHAVPPEWKGNEDEFTDLICREMIPAAWEWFENSHFFEKDDPCFFIDIFCEKGAFNLDQSKKILSAAKQMGFEVKAHVDEFTNLGCAEYAIGLGAASIDHLDATSDREIELLARSETVGVVTPTVNFNFGSAEFAPARKMIDRGCGLAISTDYNPGSAPCPSLFTAMAIACRYQKLLPAEVLNAATLNAAFAVGRGRLSGSIEIGKRADLIILKYGDYREAIYEFGSNPVKQIILDGQEISV